MSESESPLSPEFAQRLFEFGTRYTAAIYWHVSDDDLGRRVKANGSIFFVRFTMKIFGITADHVLTRYLEHLKEHSDLECQVGCLKYSPEQHIIDRSPVEDRDLAVLEFAQEDLAYIERSPWHLTARPAETLERGSPAVMFGYPGEVRRQRGENIRWIHLGAVGEATNVGLHFEPDCLVMHPPDQEIPHFGGCSGGPVFSLPADCDLGRASLFGAVTDASNDGYVKGSSIACVDETGRINS